MVMHLPLTRLVDGEVFSVDLELIQLELVVELLLPLFGQPSWSYQQNPLDLSTLMQGMQEHAGFDGFTEPHVIGNQPVEIA